MNKYAKAIVALAGAAGSLIAVLTSASDVIAALIPFLTAFTVWAKANS